MKLAHTVYDKSKKLIHFSMREATCKHVKIVSQTKKQIKNVRNIYDFLMLLF